MIPSKRDGEASPFNALSRAEQQARWLEWQSRRLSFTPAREPEDRPHPEERAPGNRAAQSTVQDAPASAPPARHAPPPALPIKPAPPPRHQELDKIKARHQAAQRTVRAWQPADKQTP